MENNEALKKKYIKIYPSYIDKQLKHSEGRKIPLSVAVENPLTSEIHAVCVKIMGLDSVAEKVLIQLNIDINKSASSSQRLA
jgi:signal recognition particle subunit SEC65